MPISPGLGVTQVEAFRESKDKVPLLNSTAQFSMTDSRKDKMELLCQVDVKVVGGKGTKRFRDRRIHWISQRKHKVENRLLSACMSKDAQSKKIDT